MDDLADLPLGRQGVDRFIHYQNLLQASALPAAITFIALCFATRLLSGSSVDRRKGDAIRPTLQPYWFLWLAHFPMLLWDPERFLRTTK